MISSVDFHLDLDDKPKIEISYKVFKGNRGKVDFVALHVGNICFFAQDAEVLFKLSIVASEAGVEFAAGQQLHKKESK